MFFKIRVVLVITESGKTKHQLFGLMCKGGRLLSFTGSLGSSVGILWSFPGSLQSLPVLVTTYLSQVFLSATPL